MGVSEIQVGIGGIKGTRNLKFDAAHVRWRARVVLIGCRARWGGDRLIDCGWVHNTPGYNWWQRGHATFKIWRNTSVLTHTWVFQRTWVPKMKFQTNFLAREVLKIFAKFSNLVRDANKNTQRSLQKLCSFPWNIFFFEYFFLPLLQISRFIDDG